METVVFTGPARGNHITFDRRQSAQLTFAVSFGSLFHGTNREGRKPGFD